MNPISRLLLLVLVAATLAGLAPAQDEPPRRRRDPSQRRNRPASRPSSDQLRALREMAGGQSEPAPTSDATSTSTASSTTQSAEKKDHYFAVINGLVHTVAGSVLDGATILCKNGKIVEIGRTVALPPETEVLDATDRFVYPGLVVASPASSIHGAEPPEDSTDVFSLGLEVALVGGITTALAGNTAAKLTFGSVEDIVIRRNIYIPLSYDRGAYEARRELRADLDRVRQYLRDLRKHEIELETNKDAKPPEKEWLRDKYERYFKLLKRESVAVVSASQAADLIDVCDLARQYGIRIVVRGAHEGWIVADELGRAGVSAVVSPRRNVPRDYTLNRENGSTIENAKILHDRGVMVAIVPETVSALPFIVGVGGRELLHLNMEAAFAVRGGMTNDEALRAITIDAARILGVDDRVGSLEVGKDADMVITDGDMLSFMTQVHHTIVNGRIAYSKTADTLYAHIRPSGKPEEPAPQDDAWPKSLVWPSDFVSAPHPSTAKEPTTQPESRPASSPESEAEAAGVTTVDSGEELDE